ncbi:MAG: SAM-dependent methyltransferase [Rhizobiaceae bacterium]
MQEFAPREGEQELPEDPAAMAGDAHVVFIATVRSAWVERGSCPKNMREARERNVPAMVEVDARYRAGLDGLDRASHVILLSWLGFAPRNLIVQKPRQAPAARGTFAVRSPARPNPIGLHVVRLLALDVERGRLEIDGIDVLDGTRLIDIKPYYASTDAIPEALTGSAHA